MRKLILVLNILVMMVCTVWGQDGVWNGEVAETLEPTSENPNVYHISTAAELAKLAELVNDGNDFAGKTVILQNDIVLNVGVLDEDEKLNETNKAQFKQWIPIGRNEEKEDDDENLLFFKGTFDGGGYKVSGVYIQNKKDYQGLFGGLGENGVIQNVGMVDSYVEGKGSVGGVCASSYGSIVNSYNAGSVTRGIQVSYVGGVCGDNYGSIVNSCNIGSVMGEDECFVGGVCGLSGSGSISNSYNTGLVTGGAWAFIGGVCGYNSSSILNSYNAGLITGGTGAKVGSVCGQNYNSTISGCYYLTGTAGTGIGNERYDETKTKSAEPEYFVDAVNEGLVLKPNTPWVDKATVDDGNITFLTFTQIPEQGEDDFWLISSAEDLRWFAKKVNIGCAELKGKLMQDIAVSGYTLNGTPPAEQDHWTPIGKDDDKPFKGTFDGNGYKVLGVYIVDDTKDANLGLFGYLGEDGRIENVGVEDSYVKGTGEYACVGGVCGVCYGEISNSYNTGSVKGGGDNACVGGVCGSSAEISNSYNAGSVTGGDNAKVGGVCGYNDDGQGGTSITSYFYLVGTATKGIGNGSGSGSGNERVAPKTVEDLVNEMNNETNGLPNDIWKGRADYESPILTLPAFSEEDRPRIELAIVSTDDLKNIINFETEKLKDGLSKYLVATDNSFEEITLLSGGADLIRLIEEDATLYICHLGKASEVLEYILELPDAPTDITATTTEEGGVQVTPQEGIEYSMDGNDWSPNLIFKPVNVDKLIFYARYKASQDKCRFLSEPATIEVTLYSITITSSGNGSVSANKTNVAIDGEEITLTVTPKDGYELASLTVTNTDVSGSGNTRTFTMPKANVTVTATFKEVKPAPAPDPTPDPEPVYYTVTIPSEITGAIIHGGGTHQVREGSYIDFSIEIDPAGTGEYPTVTVDGYWWNTLRPDTRGNYRVYVYDDDCDICIGEVSGYGTYTLTLPADSLFEGDDLYRSGVGIAVTPASSSSSSDALRYPFGTELTLTAVSDRHRAFVEWMDGSRRSPLTFRLREDTEAYAWFRALHPVGNEEIAVAGIRIRTERGGSIVIDTPTRLPIAIYALSGQCLRRSESEGTTRFSGLSEGCYLVAVGRHSEVVIVR